MQAAAAPTIWSAYASAGTYTITVVVSDPSDATDTETLVIDVVEPNAPPTITSVNVVDGATPMAGQPVSLSILGSDDSGTAPAISIDWGDNTDPTDAATPHTYTAPGTYTVTITATDAAGLTAVTYGRIVIEAPPIELVLPGNASGRLRVDSEQGQPGAVVEYNVEATGGVGPVAVTCTPASGSFFPIGETTSSVWQQTPESLRRSLYEASARPLH